MSQAMTVFRKELKDVMGPQFARVLPAHLPAERLNRTIESAVAADPKLLECNRQSLWRSCMTAAVFGLEVDGRQSAIVRFKQQAQLIPMVHGLVALAYNAGFMLDADIVREADEFHYSRGDGATIHHQPSRNGLRGTDNPVVAAYAIAWPIGHRPDRIFHVCEAPDIIDARERSSGWKAYKAGRIKTTPWETDYDAMARKTPIRRLANQLPWQVQKAAEVESRADRGEVVSVAAAADGGVIVEGEAEVLDEGAAA